MTFKKVGSRLVIERLQQYLSGTRSAATATTEIGKAAGDAGKGVEGLNVRSIALGTTIGNLATGAIQRFTQGLMSMGQQAVSVVSAHERLTLSTESLVAKELRAADATLSMEDALAQAAPRAEELLGWIQQLAIESPFDVQGVAAAFRTALAYNFTSSEAQRLTQITIDYASASGQSTAAMNQIALALGQIKAKGKLAGQEILQLVNAGISVNPILEEMGFTVDDVSKGLVSADAFLAQFATTMEDQFGGAAARSTNSLSGLLNSLGDIKDMLLRAGFGPIFEAALPFLTAFVDKLQTMIPVVQVIGEYIGQFTAFLMANIGTIIRITAAISAFILVLAATAAAVYLVINAGVIWAAVSAAMTAATVALGAAFTFLLSPIGILSAALVAIGLVVAGLAALFIFSFSDIRDKAGAFFEDFSGNMFEFGKNLVMMFAEGLAAAMSAVISVLNQIGQIISHWLAPGSPPKLLPDIDKWGTSAMNEFLGGFTKANFGIFKQLSGTLTKFMRSMVTGKSGKKDLIANIIGTRGAIANAITQLRETGEVGKAAMDKIFTSMGNVNPEVKRYVSLMFEQEMAMERVRKAQERVNEITKKYREAIAPIDKELKAIQERRDKFVEGQRIEQLQNILGDPNAPAAAREFAMLELREIQLKQQKSLLEDEANQAMETAGAELTAAEIAAGAAKEQLDVQMMLIDAQIEHNQLLREQMDLMRGGGGGSGAPKVGGGAGGLAGIGAGLGGLPALAMPELPSLEAMKEKLAGFLEELSAPFADIGGQLTELSATWSTTFIRIGGSLTIFKENFQQAYGIASFLVASLIAKVWELDGNMRAAFAAAGVTFSLFGELIKIGVIKVIDLFLTLFLPAIMSWKESLAITWELVTLLWNKAVEYIKLGIQKLIEWFIMFLAEIISWGVSLKIVWDGVVKVFMATKNAIILGIQKIIEWFKTLKEKAINLKEIWSNNFEEIGSIAETIKGRVISAFSPIIDKIQTMIDFVGRLKEAFMNFLSFLQNADFSFDFEWPDIPNPWKTDSPIAYHTRLKAFEDYLKSAKFGFDLQTPQPVAASAGATTIINNNQVTGVGEANISDGMDMATLKAFIIETIQEAIGG